MPPQKAGGQKLSVIPGGAVASSAGRGDRQAAKESARRLHREEELGAKTSVEVSVFVGLLHRLLSDSEVKLVITLLEHLARSQVGKTKMNIGRDEMHQIFLSFVQEQRKNLQRDLRTTMSPIEGALAQTSYKVPKKMALLTPNYSGARRRASPAIGMRTARESTFGTSRVSTSSSRVSTASSRVSTASGRQSTASCRSTYEDIFDECEDEAFEEPEWMVKAMSRMSAQSSISCPDLAGSRPSGIEPVERPQSFCGLSSLRSGEPEAEATEANPEPQQKWEQAPEAETKSKWSTQASLAKLWAEVGPGAALRRRVSDDPSLTSSCVYSASAFPAEQKTATEKSPQGEAALAGGNASQETLEATPDTQPSTPDVPVPPQDAHPTVVAVQPPLGNAPAIQPSGNAQAALVDPPPLLGQELDISGGDDSHQEGKARISKTVQMQIPAKEDDGDRHDEHDEYSDLSGEEGSIWSDDDDEDQNVMVQWGADVDHLSIMQIDWLGTPSDRWMMHPNSLRCAWFDCLVVLAIACDCVLVPLRICYQIDAPSPFFWLLTSIFTFDICFSFNQGYFRGSVLIMRRSWAARKYVRGFLLLDLAATIPWGHLLNLSDVDVGETTQKLSFAANSLRCLRILRVLKLGKLMDSLQEFETSQSYFVSILLSLTKMMMVMGLLCHWSACVFGLIGDHSWWGDEPPFDWTSCVPGGPCEPGITGSAWRRRYGLDNFSPGTQYVVALHFATALITGGELPLQPGSGIERVYVTSMMLLGLFGCAAVLSQVLTLFNRIAEQSISVNESVRTMRRFMIENKVEPEMQAKVRRFLEGQAKAASGTIEDANVLDLLSPSLRTEMTVYLYQRVIIKHPFFASIPSEALQRICLHCVPTNYEPGDIVVERGQLALTLMFINKGKLSIEMDGKSTVSIASSKNIQLKVGNWLGDKCLFVETRRTNTVKAVVHASVLNVPKRAVVVTCNEYPTMQDLYMECVRRTQNGENIGCCQICGKQGHNDEDCPQRDNKITAVADGEDGLAGAAGAVAQHANKMWNLVAKRNSQRQSIRLSTVGPM